MTEFTTTASDHNQDDVQGFVVPLAVAGWLAFTTGLFSGIQVTTAILDSQEKGTLKGIKPREGTGGGRS